MLEVGEIAPDFELPTGDRKSLRLSEVAARNKAVVLAFYIFDFSPV